MLGLQQSQSIVAIVVVCVALSNVQQVTSSNVDLSVAAVNTTKLNTTWTVITDPSNYVTSFNLTWTNSSTSSAQLNATDSHYVIVGLTAGTHYTVILCPLFNDSDIINTTSCESTSHSTYPDTPILTVFNRSTNTIVLTWTPPSSYDYCNLTVQNLTSPTPSCFNNHTAIATGLTAGAQYKFTVTVHSGIYTATSNNITDRTYPLGPTDIHVTKRTTNTMAFNWTQTGVITSCSLTGGASQGQGSCDYISHTAAANDLTAGSKYDFTITVWSGQFNTSNSSIGQYTVPSSPTNIAVTGKSTTSMTFTWTQNGTIERCNLTSISNTGSSGQTLCYYHNRTAIATGLTPGTQYDFTIIVTSGTLSNYSSITQITEPAKVTNVSAVTTEHTINVTWVEPAGDYTGFDVYCVGLKGAVSTSTNTSVESPVQQGVHSALCANVTAGALYNITVYTILNDSQSQPSDILQTITVPLPPETVTTWTVSVSSVNVTWRYNYNNNVSQCTHFVVTHNTSNGHQNATTVPSSQTLYTVTGLTSDKLYNIDVQAATNNSQQTQISKPVTQPAWTLPMSVFNMTFNNITLSSLNVLITAPAEHTNIMHYILLVADVNVNGNIIQKIQLNCQNILFPVSKVNCLLNNSDSVNQSVADVTCGPQVTYNITDLKPNTVYNISIQAVNPGGCSDVAYITQTTAESYPECILASNITAVPSNYSIQLTWSAPAKPNGNITHYVVHYIDQYNSTNNFTQTENGTETTLDSLHPYTNYSITVVPYTSIGPCQNPQYITSSTHIGYPYHPTITHVEAVNSTQISVTWTLPTERPTAPETYYTVTATDGVDPGITFTASSTGTKVEQTVNIANLDEYWNYTVSMIAYTEDSVRYSVDSTNTRAVKTSESTPGPVATIDARNSSDKGICYEAVVSWTAPAQRDHNGIITGYTVYWIKSDGTGSQDKQFDAAMYSATLTVDAEKAYNFTVKAKTQVGLGIENVTYLDTTGTCKPKAVDETGGVSVFQNASMAPDTTKQFNAAFDSNIFTNNDNGEIRNSGIIVAEDDETLAAVNESWSYMFNQSNTWAQVKNDKVVREYRATADDWKPPSPTRTRSTVTMVTETIGQSNCDNKADTEYCNGYVPSGRKYRLRAIICTSQGCYVTKYSSLVFITNSNPASLAWIAGVVIPCLLLIAAVVVIFILWRRNKKLKKSNSYRQNGSHSSNSTERRSTFHPDYKRSIPIKISQFADEVEDKHRNANLRFAEEYEGIKELSEKHATTAAEMSQNRVKNRYTNILPFDHSRVKLFCYDETNDDPGADYINANYLEDKKGARDYIAAQGPMTGTIDHFWQLIWEQQVSYIVMVTSLVDKGREKCAKYWPEPVGNSLTYGDIQVKLVSERDVDQFYTVRTFDVSFRNVRRRVTQFYCDKIPDYGIPEDIDLFLDFIRRVRQTAGTQLDPPIVVHCSAGVGRTGTFIAIERLLRYMQSSDTLDIVDLILNMRKYRTWMVQTEAQYICIHDCVKRAIERGFDLPEGTAVNSGYNQDEPVYENTRPPNDNCSTYANIAFQSDTPLVSTEDVELLPIPAARKSFPKT